MSRYATRRMDRSLVACFAGTFTLRFSTGLTGTLLGFYLVSLSELPDSHIGPFVVGLLAAMFYISELVLAPPFGILSDRAGHHRVMQVGPFFGGVAVILTGLTRGLTALGAVILLPVLALTRILEGASTAASVPSILGYIAMVTAGDEQLRGRSAALFEAATLGGIGVGFIVAPKLFEAIGVAAFFLNALVYVGSFLIYRFGVADPRGEQELRAQAHPDSTRKYLELLSNSRVLLLAPTWIAINAAIGLWVSQSIFAFARRDDRFPGQLLHRGFDATEITIAALVIFAIFGAGLFFWGNRFKSMRRTTIILYGIIGGAVLVGSCLVVNHSGQLPIVLPAVFLGCAAAGLFVLAGATPAALGLLADVSEAFPADRGAIMGLYSVFLAVGQISGSLIGGVAADLRGIDGLLVATLVLLAIALVPLFRLRALEHVMGSGGEVSLTPE
ncbi:MAG: MFS transporter [Candidatus Limnocylindrales bacterium]